VVPGISLLVVISLAVEVPATIPMLQAGQSRNLDAVWVKKVTK
jgi:hypothetical protein